MGGDEGKKERARMHAHAWESTKGSLKGSSSDVLELELHTVESCLIEVLETKLQPSERTINTLNCWVISPPSANFKTHYS